MRKIRIATMVCLFALFGVCSAGAAVVNLFEYAFNVDGTVSNITLGDPVPAVTNLAGFDTVTGLGTVTVTLSGAGSHYVGLFVDHEIDEATNTFFNEFGAASGAPAVGQSWEIDEPGYFYGDIYANFQTSSLDGTNGVPGSAPDDVSMALGWNFELAADETAIISFLLGANAPAGGFYLSQYDPDSQAGVYSSSALVIEGGGTTVPEPSTLLLLGNGLAGAAWFGRRRFAKK